MGSLKGHPLHENKQRIQGSTGGITLLGEVTIVSVFKPSTDQSDVAASFTQYMTGSGRQHYIAGLVKCC